MQQSGSFGKLIRDYRKSLGMTQVELGKRVGCAAITIRKIEADELRCSVQIAERLAQVFNLSETDSDNFVRLARENGLEPPPQVPSPQPAPEEIGAENLSGRSVHGFLLGERLGAGSFGVVYRATQPSVEREVAVKIILPRYANHPDFICRFEAEARLVALLEHPHIVPLYDFWREPGAAYLVMRLLRGGSLEDRLKQGPLPPAFVLQVLEQIGQALHAAHRSGVVHRDIKPANLLLDEEDNMYLADFGIARQIAKPRLTNQNQDGFVVATPAYSSPEQLRSEEVSPQADIYSLGVMLYEMLAGKHPFHDSKTGLEYVLKHLNEPLPSLAACKPDLPAALDQVIQTATAKQAQKRYSDVPELVAAVRAVLLASGPDAVLDAHLPLEPAADLGESPIKDLHSFGEDEIQKAVTAENCPSTSVSLVKSEQVARKKSPATIRGKMLQLVWNTWIEGVLKASLFNEMYIDLGMQTRQGAVEQPWEKDLQMPEQPDEDLPPGTKILEVFDESNDSLLILGEPGAGKTNLLLDLARQVIQRAETDSSQPVPVIFNLSAWKDPRKKMTDWLVEEFREKYYINKRVSAKWIEEEELLLLLDGLDEVEEDQRESCVAAINNFLVEHPVPMVVCSRVADYEKLPKRLRFHTAICLQPLALEQVDGFLNQTGEELANVRQAILGNPELQELVETPLMLNLVTQAYLNTPELEVKEITSRKQLFEVYTETMFNRAARKKDERFTKEQTLHWLGWLASRMMEKDKTIFYIEDLMPDWLPGRLPKFLYQMILGIFVTASAFVLFNLEIFLVLFVYVILQSGWVTFTIIFDTLFFGVGFWGLLLSIVLGLFAIKPGKFPGPLEVWKWSWKKSIPGAVIGLAAGFLLARDVLYGGNFYVLGNASGLIIENSIKNIYSGAFSLLGILLGSLVTGIRGIEVPERVAQGQGIRSSVRNSLVMGFSAMIASSLITVMLEILPSLYGPYPDLNIGSFFLVAIPVGLIMALVFGGRYVLHNLLTRMLLTFSHSIPTRFSKFLEYATERLFLHQVGGGYIFIHRLLMEHMALPVDGERLKSAQAAQSRRTKTARRMNAAWGWAGFLLSIELFGCLCILPVTVFVFSPSFSRIDFPPTVPPVQATEQALATYQAAEKTLEAFRAGSKTRTAPIDGMVQAYIPTGSLIMGIDNEIQPAHTVTLSTFWMDTTEITNAMYARCVATGACSPPHTSSSSTREEYYGNPVFDHYPVIAVDWNQAAAYCAWTGRQLPTDAQWEYAAHGGLNGRYPWGDNETWCGEAINNPEGYYGGITFDCYLDDNGDVQYFQDTVSVGQFSPNGYGLYDVVGNVSEWVADWYGEDYSQFPKDGWPVDPAGPETGQYRVFRGEYNLVVRSQAVPSYRGYKLGFRCASTP